LWGTVGWVAAGWLLGYWLSNPVWLTHALALFGRDGPQPELSDMFRLAGLLSLTLAAYALTLPHTPPQRRLTNWLAPLAALRLLRQRDFAVFWCCSLGVCLTIPFTYQGAPLLLKQLGVRQAWISPTLTLGQSMEIVSLALLPMLLLRLGVRGCMLLGLGAWVLYLGILTLGEPLWLVAASMSLNGLCICGYIVAGQVFVNSRAGADVRASAQALLTFVNSLGLLIGNLLFGGVRQHMEGRLPPTFGVGTAIVVVLVLAFLVGFQNDEMGEKPEKRLP
jgi:predicted MFS family arabinose efflux permease